MHWRRGPAPRGTRRGPAGTGSQRPRPSTRRCRKRTTGAGDSARARPRGSRTGPRRGHRGCRRRPRAILASSCPRGIPVATRAEIRGSTGCWRGPCHGGTRGRPRPADPPAASAAAWPVADKDFCRHMRRIAWATPGISRTRLTTTSHSPQGPRGIRTSRKGAWNSMVLCLSFGRCRTRPRPRDRSGRCATQVSTLTDCLPSPNPHRTPTCLPTPDHPWVLRSS